MICCTCKTVYTDIEYSEIPQDKILTQRKRYSASRSSASVKMLERYASFAMGAFGGGHSLNPLAEILSGSDDGWGRSNTEIKEDDAGQADIDKEKSRKREEQRQIEQEERNKLAEDAQKFKGFVRNDKCACVSGKKYNQCCQSKYAHIV